MKKKQIITRLKSVELIDVCLKHPDKSNIHIQKYNFNINIEQKINNENKLIIVIIDIKIMGDDKLLELGSIKTSNIYEILNFNDFIISDTDTAEFPEKFMMDLNSISISTTRGIMFSQFSGTYLHNAILPIIEIKALQKKENK